MENSDLIDKGIRNASMTGLPDKSPSVEAAKMHSEQAETTILSTTVVRLLAESNYLTTPDLGCFLLLTSPKIDSDSQVLWMALCSSYWGFDQARIILKSTPLTPQECFRSFIHPKPLKLGHSIPNLKFSPKDYLIFIEVTLCDNNGKTIILETIRGEDVPQFFSEGSLSFSLKGGPVDKKTGRFLCNHNLRRCEYTIRLLRSTDRKILEIVSRGQACYYSDEEDTKIDDYTWRLERAYMSEKVLFPLNGVSTFLRDRLYSTQEYPAVIVELDERFTLDPAKSRLVSDHLAHIANRHLEGEFAVYGFDITVGFKDCCERNDFRPWNENDKIRFAHILESMSGWRDI